MRPAAYLLPARRGVLLTDLALAVVLLAVSLAEVWVPLDSRQGDGSAVVSTVGVVLTCTALALRRRAPLPVAAVVLLGWPVVLLLGPVYLLFYGQFVVMGLALFTVVRLAPGRQAWAGLGVAALTLLGADLAAPLLQDPNERVFHWGVFALVVAAAAGLRRHEARAQAHLRRAVASEVAAAQRAMAAVADERARIARELHDIVAHSVSSIVVQAGAAEQVVDDDPDHVRTALETIRRTGTDALAEMRRTVAVLRDTGADLEPQPGLEQGLPALVQAARDGGLDTDLVVEGTPRALPAGVDLAAYRIVQEALSNVRRHADASSVRVRVCFGADELSLEVVDDGGGAGVLQPGHGMVGMRERVALYGGRLETLSQPGFTVRAWLPVAAS